MMMVVSWALVATTFAAAGYCLKVMCLMGRLGRDRRPACASVFVLVAFGIMELSWVTSPYHATSGGYAWAWIVIDFALLGIIWWLVGRGGAYGRGRGIADR